MACGLDDNAGAPAVGTRGRSRAARMLRAMPDPRDWLGRIRLRVFALLIGLALAAVAMISLTTVPAWPVLGFAVISAAVAVNTMASKLRLGQTVCLHCGCELRDRVPGVYGIECPECGGLNPSPTLARDARDESDVA